MKAIMISIKPKWVAKILNGEKTIEIRKTKPNVELPIDVYIYCTKDKKSGLHYSKEYGAFNDLVGGCEHYSTIGDGCGKVVAKFTLNKVEEISYFDELQIPDGYEDYDGNWVDTSEYAKDIHWVSNGTLKQSCLSYDELHKYLGKKTGYAIHISDLEIFDKPKELNEFTVSKTFMPKTKPLTFKHKLTKSPQSWGYVEE